jgi:hypothetical protein
MSDERTEHGDPIYRYGVKNTPKWTAPDMSGSSLEQIGAHITKHVGPVETVFHELVSDLVHIDVHIVAPQPQRSYYTLITSGMSDRPMKAPAAAANCRFAELMLCLPANWPMKEADWKDDRNYWPIRWLKILARFPHQYQTWLWLWHTMPNGDPPAPLAGITSMSGWLLAPPMTVSTEFWKLPISPEKTIHFFSILPIFADEMNLKLKSGAEELVARFEKAKVTEIIDVKRRSVLAKPWWRII